MGFTFFIPYNTEAQNVSVSPEKEVVVQPLKNEEQIAHSSISELIRAELGEVFVDIARCESGLRQHNEDGSVLVSRTSDKGLFQINQVHWSTAEKMGINLDTVEGNIAYAKYLKEQRGTKDWYASAHCWS